MLLHSLPPIVHIRRESDKAAMRWSLERMREELREGGWQELEGFGCVGLAYGHSGLGGGIVLDWEKPGDPGDRRGPFERENAGIARAEKRGLVGIVPKFPAPARSLYTWPLRVEEIASRIHRHAKYSGQGWPYLWEVSRHRAGAK
jgi:hypothetical protein